MPHPSYDHVVKSLQRRMAPLTEGATIAAPGRSHGEPPVEEGRSAAVPVGLRQVLDTVVPVLLDRLLTRFR